VSPHFHWLDATDRTLDRSESRFVSALETMLLRTSPAQLDENSTALMTSGRETLIAILPHRALGGVALCVRVDGQKATIFWTQILTLRAAADLPKGFEVARCTRDSQEHWISPAVEALRVELSRSIEVAWRAFDDDAYSVVEYSLDVRNKSRPLGSASVVTIHPLIGRESTALMSSTPPGVIVPVPALEWLADVRLGSGFH
jgi:hypothetical protein